MIACRRSDDKLQGAVLRVPAPRFKRISGRLAGLVPSGRLRASPVMSIPPQIAHDDPGRSQKNSAEEAFLLRVTELLHAYGTPAFRLEHVLQLVARGLKVEASFLAAPTAVLVSIGSVPDRVVHLLRSDSGEVDLGKLVEFDEIMEGVVGNHSLSAEDALTRLDAVADAPPRYRGLIAALGFGGASATASVFFGGGPVDFIASLVIALAIFVLARWLPRRSDTIGAFEPLAAFLAALTGTLIAGAGWGVDGRVVTLASLIILLPGLSLTIGFSELASKHLISGMARIAGAGAVFLTLVFGVAMGWRLGGVLCEALFDPSVTTRVTVWPEVLAASMPWLAAAVAPFAFAVLMQARVREFGIIHLTSFLGFTAAMLTLDPLGADIGPFVGALVVGLLSNFYARVSNRPALVPLTPGILMLVPGSLGFRSLTSFLDAEALEGMAWAFQTGMVAVALVGGLLAANMLLPPRRAL